jgi:hypothetical protein
LLYLLSLPSNFVDEAKRLWHRLSSWIRVDDAVQRLRLDSMPVGTWVTVGVAATLLATGNTCNMLHQRDH